MQKRVLVMKKCYKYSTNERINTIRDTDLQFSLSHSDDKRLMGLTSVKIVIITFTSHLILNEILRLRFHVLRSDPSSPFLPECI